MNAAPPKTLPHRSRRLGLSTDVFRPLQRDCAREGERSRDVDHERTFLNMIPIGRLAAAGGRVDRVAAVADALGPGKLGAWARNCNFALGIRLCRQ